MVLGLVRGPMSLAGMIWKRVAVHEVVAAFLRSEAHRLAVTLSPASAVRLMPVITAPNTSDPLENHARPFLRVTFDTAELTGCAWSAADALRLRHVP